MNGDAPAFPETHIYHWRGQDKEVGETDNVVPRYMGGLTKREYFSIELLKAEVTGRYASGEVDLINVDGKKVIGSALNMADALIAELSKDQKEK